MQQFSGDVRASLSSAAQVHGIAYVPGAADLGDFDATSTTIALAPAGEGESVPDDLLRETFERYWKNFIERRDGPQTWTTYTPYELRVVGTFVRLGWRQRAHELLDYFFKDQRPQGWNQWAEVVGRDARQPRFVGDMPHAWISSDYIRSVLDMFVYERQRDKALVLAAGVEDAWFDGPGFAARNLRTPYGTLNLSIKRQGDDVVLDIDGDARPPGGFYFPSPWATPPDAQRVGGEKLAWQNGELHIPELPAHIRIGVNSSEKPRAER